MSLVRRPPPQRMGGATAERTDLPRRGRPPARNEILRQGLLGGHRPEDLADKFGTPFYVYDLDVVSHQVAALRAVLPPIARLAFALKANPALGVVGHLARLGLGADIASGGELDTALRAGIVPERIVFTGPGKRDEELRRAVDARVGVITVESMGELRRLERVAAAAGRCVPVLLRAAAAPEAGRERIQLIGDGGAGKFGMDPVALASSARFAARSPHLEPLGLHVFGASNVLEASALVTHVRATMAAARLLARESGFPLRLIDVGGGLGIPYEVHEESLDLIGLGHGLAALAREWAADPLTADAEILFEPGRFLVGPAGAYVSRVLDRKTVGGREIAILDGGIHHLLRPALVGQEHRVRRLTASADRSTRFTPITLAGPLCTGSDVLATDAVLQDLEPGDLVAVLDVGAYGFTESMPFFLSHPIPPEIAVRDGRVALLRPRLEPATWLGWQSDPGL
ncbi:MAG: type III PLP-dependent enzyme [Chloroflexota bacterium]|mgnify:CR=1 FL=1